MAASAARASRLGGGKSRKKGGSRKRSAKAGRTGSRRGRRKTQAQLADKYDLYQKSVQEPDPDLALIARMYRQRYGCEARLLREDFCGTALMASRWITRNPENRAWGIDLDPEPLAWGREHNVAKLRPEQAARIKLIQGDVRDIGHEQVDITIAFNFSYFLFLERSELLSYFRKARASLRPQGLFVLDAYGGADAHRTSEEERDLDDFDYIWDQHRFDPIRHRAINYIHFESPDGSELRKAFSYEWRLWTLPEVRDLLAEAGFARSGVYWEGTTDDNEPNGVFSPREKAIDDPAWVAYIAAEL